MLALNRCFDFDWTFVHPPYGDPGLVVHLDDGPSILFDCPDLTPLSGREINRISLIAVTHLHMDHWIGFDQVIRCRYQQMPRLVGPPEIIASAHQRVSSYAWNLVETPQLSVASYPCNDVDAVALDHGILSYCLKVPPREKVSINSESLLELGLPPGKWLQNFKLRALRGDFEGMIEVGSKTYDVSALASRLLLFRVEPAIVYLTDAWFSTENLRLLGDFIPKGAVLFAETCFAKDDVEEAKKKRHFTTDQIAQIAVSCQVESVFTFHYSPRYSGKLDLADEFKRCLEIRSNNL